MTVSAFLFRNKYHVTYKFCKIKRRIVNNKENIGDKESLRMEDEYE